MGIRPLILLLILGWSASSCALSIAPPSSWFERQGRSVPPPPSAHARADSLLASYRPEFDRRMGMPLTVALDPFTASYPESGLGNFVADAMRSRAAREIRSYIHAAVLDAGSLQRTIDSGPVTRAAVHELMPYDNTLVVVTMKGMHLETLAEELLSQPFIPVSGMRLSVREGRAGHLLIGRQTVDADADYLIATSSWLAAGNGPLTSLWSADDMLDTGILLRDIFIEAFQGQHTIAPTFDQRVIDPEGDR
jgi:2',3'-cyclic-nucleotide 2'-phosphodiesterase (5'-nucleotidase family)